MNTESRRLIIAAAIISAIAFGVGFGAGTSVDRAAAAPPMPGSKRPPGGAAPPSKVPEGFGPLRPAEPLYCTSGFGKNLHPKDPTGTKKYYCRSIASLYCLSPLKPKEKKFNKGMQRFQYLCKK